MFPATPSSAAGEISMTKFVNGERSTAAPGPTVQAGTTVRHRYVITISSSVPLYDFVVTDTGGVSPDCDLNGDGKPDGYNGHPGPLSNGSQFVCYATETAGGPGLTKASIGRVKAYNFDVTASFEADDVSHYTTVAPPTTASAPTSSTAAPPTAAPPTAAATTDAATTGTAAEAATTATVEDADNDPSSSANPPSSERTTTQSTTLGGDSNNWQIPSTQPSNPDSTTDVANETSTLDDESAFDRQDTNPGDGDRNESDVDAPAPSALRFGDDFSFSFLLALAAAGAGVGIAVFSHRMQQRKRDSAPGDARG